MPDNVDTAKAIYEAFGKGDMEALGKAGSFECPYSHLVRFADGKLARAEFHTDSAKAKAALG